MDYSTRDRRKQNKMEIQPPQILTNHMHHSSEGHFCPQAPKGMLPQRISEAASAGRVKEVCDWLDNGGDINVTDDLDHTLLHNACDDNQEEVVKRLLQYPDIHLNIRLNAKPAYTPLAMAAAKGHRNIIEILLNAKLPQCAVDLSMYVDRHPRNTGVGISAIMIAVENRKWEAVKLMLSHYRDIRVWEACHILKRTVDEYQHDIAEMIIEGNCPFRESDFSSIIQELYLSKKWSLLETVFRKSVQLDNDSSLRLFQPLLFHKDWSNLEKYLQILDPNVKLQADMVEAVLSNDKSKTMEIIEQVKVNRDEIMAGTLLIACTGGTNEEIADMLLKNDSICYSDRTLNKALLLSSLNNNIEFIQNLLLMQKFTFKILARSRNLSGNANHKIEVNNLFNTILEQKAKEFVQAQKDSECDSDNKNAINATSK